MKKEFTDNDARNIIAKLAKSRRSGKKKPLPPLPCDCNGCCEDLRNELAKCGTAYQDCQVNCSPNH